MTQQLSLSCYSSNGKVRVRCFSRGAKARLAGQKSPLFAGIVSRIHIGNAPWSDAVHLNDRFSPSSMHRATSSAASAVTSNGDNRRDALPLSDKAQAATPTRSAVPVWPTTGPRLRLGQPAAARQALSVHLKHHPNFEVRHIASRLPGDHPQLVEAPERLVTSLKLAGMRARNRGHLGAISRRHRRFPHYAPGRRVGQTARLPLRPASPPRRSA